MKTFCLIALLWLTTGCQNSSENGYATDSTVFNLPRQEGQTLTEAKSISKEIIDLIEKEKSDKITRKQLDLKAMPMQRRLDSLIPHLSSIEAQQLDSFRASLVIKLAEKFPNGK